MLVFFDDILIYSRSLEEHPVLLRQVLELLQKDHWQVKRSKCVFAQRQLKYLGHVISEDGVTTDPEKVQTVAQWPVPTTVKELCSFLGLAGYYRRFVQHFAIIARPLNDLLKKGSIFLWTLAHDQAFQALKQALISAPVLGLLDFSKPFCIEADASGHGIGAVLSQDSHPLAYLSKALCPCSQALSTYEKEYLAILLAVEQWRYYLQHSDFKILTDHKSLAQLSEQRLHTPWQQKVFSKLLGLQYKIIYRQGKDNHAADALSQFPLPYCSAVSVVQPQWLSAVCDSYLHDAHAQQLISKLTLDPAPVPNFTFRDGLLRYKQRIWIGQQPELHLQLIEALHTSAVGGHSGVPVTYRRVKQFFAWTGMKSVVQEFVQRCLVRQQAKADRSCLPGLLQPLPVPDRAWKVISMDFIEASPLSGGFNCVLVVVDTFSKYAHFLGLKHPFTAAGVAKLFLSQVYKLHGMPTAIVSDRDRIFTSTLWWELFRLAKVDLCMSTAYHPQSDGQTEGVNQCLETYLRCYVHACPRQWSAWLDLAEFWYNTSMHSALGKSPFEVLYGFAPQQFGLHAADDPPVSDLAKWLLDRELMTDVIRQHLNRAKQTYEEAADSHHSERSFQIGEWVFLKLQPYVQSSLADRAHQKLAFKFFEPFRVVERIGSVAYRLELPASSSIHLVFHVSQLKKVVGAHQVVSPSLPSAAIRWSIPVSILQHRTILKGTSPTRQGLIQWSNLPCSLSTWEDLDYFRQQFPR